MGTEINMVIENLCGKFGVTADYLLPKIVRYLTVMSAAGMIASLIAIVIFTKVIRIMVRNGKKWAEDFPSNYDWADNEMYFAGVVVSCMALFCATIVLIVNLYDLVSVLASPEVAVIKYVLHLIK